MSMSTGLDSGISLTRRTLLKGAGALAGLALYLRMSPSLGAEEVRKYGADAMPGGTVDNPLVFVNIDPAGLVTITIHRPEMGQGIRTSLAMVIADELGAKWEHVRVTQAPGDEARYGNQNTDGSRSMRHFFAPMRRVGAAARMMLEAAAAAHWGVPVAEVAAGEHEVVHSNTGRRLSYGELATAAMKQPVPERARLRLKDPSEFRYIGKSNVPLIDGPDMVSGRAQYSIDVRMDGMVYAVIARPPVLGATLAKYDDSAALKVPGVLRVVALEGKPLPPRYNALGGVAVIASNTWAAMKGREALVLEWNDGDNASYDSASYRKILEAQARKPGKVVRNDGDALAVLAKSKKRIEAEYYMPHIAHATMEPPCATARFADGRCEVWAGVQSPQEARDIIAENLGIDNSRVSVNVPLLGGGFGRRSKCDFAVEAALLAKIMEGRPVKVVWTREDDLRHDYYHTVSLQHLEAALDEQGKPIAWLHRSAAPTIVSTFVANATNQSPFEVGMGAVNVPFQIPNLRVETAEVPAHTRIGWFRSVSNIPHGVATQCFVDELAAAAGRDPKDYLLELIGPPRRIDPRALSDGWNYDEAPDVYVVDTGRLRHVIELAAREARWGRELPRGRGQGIAAMYSFLTYVAAVVEVSVENGVLTIPRIDVALDCGVLVNPDRIRAQVEGSCVMAVSLATLGEITFERGRAVQGNFHEYQISRIHEAPREIYVHLVPSRFDVPLGGVGEPAVPPIAPALLNAIYAATGKRIRQLPLRDQLAT